MNEPAAKIKPGECVWCRIESPEPGGYSVSSVSHGMEGFLPSYFPIELGRVVPSTFVCMNGDRALFTFAFIMGTSARVQHSTASDEENAFSVWAEAHPKSLGLRRAIDLVMPPLESAPILLKLSDSAAKEMFPTLEETKFTGCIKVFCESRLSRAALIFFKGRAVGSLYTTKNFPDPYPFEIGMKKMLQDVSAPDADTNIEMYDLPEGIVLSMSALFVGYLDQPAEQPANLEYAEKMMNHFSENAETACFGLMEETETPFVLGFIHEGKFKGTYNIAERVFSEDLQFFLNLLGQHSSNKLHAYILPAAMMTDAICFGYSLNSAHFLAGI